MKTFTKGQNVTHITNWDHNGTFVFRQALVYSCGKKQMILTDLLTGEEIGRHFNPEIGAANTFPVMTTEEATEKSLQMATEFLETETARYIHLSTLEEFGEAYCKEMLRLLADLHEPIATDFHKL